LSRRRRTGGALACKLHQPRLELVHAALGLLRLVAQAGRLPSLREVQQHQHRQADDRCETGI
jgi:hypothetical protein